MLTRCYTMLGDLKQPNIDAHKMLNDAWGPKTAQYWLLKRCYTMLGDLKLLDLDAYKISYDALGPKTAHY